MKPSQLIVTALAGLLLPSSAHAATATVTVDNVVVGKTPRCIGFSQGHFYPDNPNTAAWIKRSQANCFRIWAAPAYYEPRDDAPPFGDGVVDRASFGARRAALRANPESTEYINWRAFNSRFETTLQRSLNRCTLNYMCAQLQRLGVETMVVLNRRGWTDEQDWAGKWEHWQYNYAVAYHLAKNYDIAMFEPYNEPDHSDAKEIPSQALYLGWTRFACDAIHAAVADVNARYGKKLEPQILAPAITHSAASDGPYHMDADPDADPRDDSCGWGELVLRAIDTDIDGNHGNAEMFNVFSTHKYNAAPGDYFDEMALIKDRMVRYHPQHKVLPIFYSEFNAHGSRGWMAAPHNTTSLETPDVYTCLALDMSKAMLQGVYGMTVFKFSNTYSDTYGYQKTGHHFVFDHAPYNIGGSKKGAEAMRMFAKAFKGARDRYRTTTTASAGSYNAYTAYDAASQNYYTLAINSHASEDYATTFNMAALDVSAGSMVTIEELSSGHQMEVVESFAIAPTLAFTKTQPRESVWLVAVPKGPLLTELRLPAVADAQVQGGASRDTNFGASPAMTVGRAAKASGNRAAYLKFDLSAVPAGASIKRAVLRVTGRTSGGTDDFSFHVYGDTNDGWTEKGLKWGNAPDLSQDSSQMVNVGAGAWPIGNLTLNSTASIARVDVTDWVREQQADGAATFVLIRELRFDGDTADDGRKALVNSREATTDRPYLELYY